MAVAPTAVPSPAPAPKRISWAVVGDLDPSKFSVAPPPTDAASLAQEQAEMRALRGNLTKQQREAIAAWDTGYILRWNQVARDAVAKSRLDPLNASELYALLSVAQYNILLATDAYQRSFARHPLAESAGGVAPLVTLTTAGTYPSEHAAIAAAAEVLLTAFSPEQADRFRQLRAEAQRSRMWAGVSTHSDIDAGATLGQAIAQTLLDQARANLAAAAWNIPTPKGPGYWSRSIAPYKSPLLPVWGNMHPWLLERTDQFLAPPPPAFDSAEFKRALQEVRTFSDNRTAEQLRIAQFWGDGSGTAGPPGHWNQIAADLITARALDDRETAQILAYLNMALMDAGISCWNTKFTYWVIRPSQADPAITTPVGLPNFPAYTSGHASFSGAAAAFLGSRFPEEREKLFAMAEEAAMSRLYGGIHYRFDGVNGLKAGQAIGELAAQRMGQ